MKQCIRFNIDNVRVHDEIIITGWVFSTVNDRPVDIIVRDTKTNTPIAAVSLERNSRQDVLDKFSQYAYAIQSGFTLKIPGAESKAELLFADEAGNQVAVAVTKLVNAHSPTILRRIKRNLSQENVRKVRSYVAIYGWKKTIGKIIEKMTTDNHAAMSALDSQNQEYRFTEVEIPQEWVEIQKYQPVFSILMPLNRIGERKTYIIEALQSVQQQQYSRWELCLSVPKRDIEQFHILRQELISLTIHYVETPNDVSKDQALSAASALATGDYVCVLEQEDLLSHNALIYLLEAINQNKGLKAIYTDEDRFENAGSFFSPVYKETIQQEELNENVLFRFAAFKRETVDFTQGLTGISQTIRKLSSQEIHHIPKVAYHYRAVPNLWSAASKVRAIAFYLPQYHPIPENDAWWGTGFTEWVNVKRGKPLFKGHYQPRVPGQLGYYDLVESQDIQHKQAMLAQEFGIHGFCYYYYWFNGKRLLEKPLDRILADQSLTMPFCICWANENWTKRWDGLEKEILMEQVHEPDSDHRFISDILPILKDPRYIRIGGAPLLVIYKLHLLANPQESIKVWREICKENGIENLHIAIVKHPEISTPEKFSADSMVEFPPHCMNPRDITGEQQQLVANFRGGVYDYHSLAMSRVPMRKQPFTYFRGCMLQWDNTARRMETASIFHNFSIAAYKKWLLDCTDYVHKFQPTEEQIVFINAWNEWAEGTYLEPDEAYGTEYLEATRDVLNCR